MEATLQLKVAEASPDDVGKGWARMSPDDIRALNCTLGDIIEISAEKRTVARLTGTIADETGKDIIRIDGITRSNAQANLGELVQVRKMPRKTAVTVLVTPLDVGSPFPTENELDQFPKILQGLAILADDKLSVPFLGGKERLFHVEATSPTGGVIINQKTKFVLKKPDFSMEAPTHVSYEDVGGLGHEVRLVREMVELPLRYADVFERLGVEAPKGVLLYGPPGTGKTLIARAIASETKLHFIRINGPEIIHKFYGESEAKLREIFQEAATKEPSIIFIDEIDALAPKRAEVLGDVEKRVVAQLLALMDGVVSRGRVVVIGATNIPEMIDPALRRPGRFDREIVIPVPNAEGRLAILKIHSRRMPLAPDVDLARLAGITHAFVGADLEALCKEAGMVALRRYISDREENHVDSHGQARGTEVTYPSRGRDHIHPRLKTWSSAGPRPGTRDVLSRVGNRPSEHREREGEAGAPALRVAALPLEGATIAPMLEAILDTPGQLQVRMDDFLTGLREVEPTATREFYTERSTVRWDHVGGLDEIKEILVSVVDWPARYPELFAQGRVMPPRGILFTGPSGTGKTLMARALAGETGLNFMNISAPILFSKWLGESEKALHQVFKKAKQSAPCILFFDEIDALGTVRGSAGDTGVVERMASQFFNELDNLSDLSQVIVLGATNREDLLDPALMRAGRLDYVLRFPLPDAAGRLEILKVHTQERPLGRDVNLEELARLTEGMSGSHIAFICRNAAMLAISESIQGGEALASAKLVIEMRHFHGAIRKATKSGGST